MERVAGECEVRAREGVEEAREGAELVGIGRRE